MGDNANYAIFSWSSWFCLGLNPVGPESQIRYSMINAPNITNDYISLDINVSASLAARAGGWLPLESLVAQEIPEGEGC